MRTSLIRHVLGLLASNKHERTDSGVFLPGVGMARGMYVHDVNGQDERCDPNLLTDEGLTHMLNVALAGAAGSSRITTWYLALYANAIAPTGAWTASNFPATAGEITSATEGYSEATRQPWVPTAAAAKVVDNYANKAAFNIVTATSVTVNGAALSSSNVRGGTAGTLMSATRFATARTLSNGDVFNCGYRMELSST